MPSPATTCSVGRPRRMCRCPWPAGRRGSANRCESARSRTRPASQRRDRPPTALGAGQAQDRTQPFAAGGDAVAHRIGHDSGTVRGAREEAASAASTSARAARVFANGELMAGSHSVNVRSHSARLRRLIFDFDSSSSPSASGAGLSWPRSLRISMRRSASSRRAVAEARELDAALVQLQRCFERQVAFLELLDDGFELGDRRLEVLDRGIHQELLTCRSPVRRVPASRERGRRSRARGGVADDRRAVGIPAHSIAPAEHRQRAEASSRAAVARSRPSARCRAASLAPASFASAATSRVRIAPRRRRRSNVSSVSAAPDSCARGAPPVLESCVRGRERVGDVPATHREAAAHACIARSRLERPQTRLAAGAGASHRRVTRCASRSMCAQKSSLRATTISAAADGVGARRSATKSAIVTSVSWPTAEIVGTGQPRSPARPLPR